MLHLKTEGLFISDNKNSTGFDSLPTGWRRTFKFFANTKY